MKQLLFFLFGILLITMQSCNENHLEPIENDGIGPAPVSNVTVENLPGAAIIKYTLPEDSDLSYVKAKYISENGNVREVKASYYLNTLKIEGFAKSQEYNILLYAVDKGENQSKPITVKVHPQKPPYLEVLESLNLLADFGGVKVEYKNTDESNLAIVVLSNDTLGNFIPYNTHYAVLKKGSFSVRGFKPVLTTFGVYIRDRWNNISDTLIVELQPLFEAKLDKTIITPLRLPNDDIYGYNGSMEALFDGNITESSGYYHTSDAGRLPSTFTFDLGVKAKLSRLSWWMRSDGGRWLYAIHNPRDYEIWGSNNPSPDGSWDNWILLGSYEVIKPSGLPTGQNSNQDVELANAGIEITFPLDAPQVRYIRWKTLRNWGDGNMVNFNEISLWGQFQ